MSENDRGDGKVTSFPSSRVAHPEHTGKMRIDASSLKPEITAHQLRIETQLTSIISKLPIAELLESVSVNNKEWFYVLGFFQFSNPEDKPSAERTVAITEAINREPRLKALFGAIQLVYVAERQYITLKAQSQDESPKTKEQLVTMKEDLEASRAGLVEAYGELVGNNHEAKEILRILDLKIDRMFGDFERGNR